MDAIVLERLDVLDGSGSVDLRAQCALPVPVHTIRATLRVPEAALPGFPRLTDAVSRGFSGGRAAPAVLRTAGDRALRARVPAHEARGPGDALLTALVQAEADRLSEDELVAVVHLLVTGAVRGHRARDHERRRRAAGPSGAARAAVGRSRAPGTGGGGDPPLPEAGAAHRAERPLRGPDAPRRQPSLGRRRDAAPRRREPGSPRPRGAAALRRRSASEPPPRLRPRHAPRPRRPARPRRDADRPAPELRALPFRSRRRCRTLPSRRGAGRTDRRRPGSRHVRERRSPE
jgi:hypothetical protein